MADIINPIPAPQELFAPRPSNIEVEIPQQDSMVPAAVSEVESKRHSHVGQLLNIAKRSGQSLIVMAELTPTNEVLRGSAFVAGEAATHSPVVGALTLGLATLAVEGTASLASASLFDTETSNKVARAVNNKVERTKHLLNKVGVHSSEETSRGAKIGATFLGGAVVGMAIEQAGDPTRTIEQNRRFGLKASGYLALACAGLGAIGSEAIERPGAAAGTAVVTGAVYSAGAKLRNTVYRTKKPDIERWQDRDSNGYGYRLTVDPDKLEAVAKLEQDVWDEYDFGNLIDEGYGPYIANSRTFAAYKGDKPIGLTRLFEANEDLSLPFLSKEFAYYDESDRERLTERAKQGLVEEVGTAAVAPEARGKQVNGRLWRMAYRDARNRGVESWGVIMEPERVEKDLNKKYGFTFKQLGEPIWYQGGWCSAYIMDLKDVARSMRRFHPLTYMWFTKLPLGKADAQ